MIFAPRFFFGSHSNIPFFVLVDGCYSRPVGGVAFTTVKRNRACACRKASRFARGANQHRVARCLLGFGVECISAPLHFCAEHSIPEAPCRMAHFPPEIAIDRKSVM